MEETWAINSLVLDRDNFVQLEPEAICHTRWFLLEYWTRFKRIYTFDSEVLAKCPNAIYYSSGYCWIKESDYKNIDTSIKQFQVSSLTGNKNWTIGHRFRQQAYNSQHLFPKNFVFFVSFDCAIDSLKNPRLEKSSDAKINIFKEFQFSIVIENSQQTNYFTEKLVDCLITKTIPIYWGCPNIKDFFNIEGWILLETDNVEEMIEKVKVLTSDYYSKYTDVIEENYQKAIGYTHRGGPGARDLPEQH
jgi:hypothetical protein